MPRICLTFVFVLLLAAGASAQFAATGNTTLSVNVGAEGSLRIDTATTTLATTGAVFNDYTGATSFTYKIRTTTTTGSGTVTMQVTSDFSPAGGPSVASPPTAGDKLAYNCTIVTPGSGSNCASSVTASTTSAQTVASFGAGKNSASAGTSGNTINWTLTNDPAYHTGTYSATVTFTISAS